MKSSHALFFDSVTVKNTYDKPQTPNPILTPATYTEAVENTEIISLYRILKEDHPQIVNWVLVFAIASVLAQRSCVFLGGVVSAAAAIVANKNTKNWELLQNFCDSIEEAMAEVGASNAYVIKCHNGGGIPRPGVPTFSTITNRFGPGSSKNIWDTFPHDGVLSRLVSEIRNSKITTTETSELGDSDLKTALEESQVEYSIQLLLDSSSKRIVYCTFHFKEKFDESKALDRLKKLRLRSHAIAQMVSDRDLIRWPLGS